MRLIRCCHASKVSTKRSSRSNVSRETGVSSSARARSAARSGNLATGGFPALPAQMSDQQGQRRRRDAVNAAGMADGARPVGLQLVAHLVGQARQHPIIEIVWQSQAFVTAVGLDVGSLAAEIDFVFRLNLELLG